MPKIVHNAILSEQLKLNDLLFSGKSNLPGLVRRQHSSYFSTGGIFYLKYLRGRAPE